MSCRELDVCKGKVGGDGAPRERAGVVRLEVGHLLRLVTVLEVRIRLVGLALTGRSQVRIGPDGRAVTLLLGPVALVCLLRQRQGTRKSGVMAGGMSGVVRGDGNVSNDGTHIPGGSAVEGFGRIVPAFAVPAHKQNLVLNVGFFVAPGVQVLDPRLKALPLRLLASCIKALVRRVCPVDQAEVDRRLEICQ